MRLRLVIFRFVPASLLFGLLVTGGAQAGPLCVDAANSQYFRYAGKTIALVGTSAEYLCHVAQVQPNKLTNQVPFLGSYCMYSHLLVPTNKNYIAYINELAARNLNVFRVWVGLNHSPGREPDGLGQPFDPDPYPNEEPFPFTTTGTQANKWDVTADLNNNATWDNTYLDNLYNVINFAQSKTPSVMVEVTLFDPWSGDWERGPWKSSNIYNGAGFATEKDFITLPINTSCATAIMNGPRKRQVDMMKRIASRLNSLNNFYWEIANEPDIGSDITGTEAAIWHDCMIQQLYDYEATLPNGHHLIGVNYHTLEALNTIKNNSYPSSVPKIKIVNTHYVQTQDPLHQGALDLVHNWHEAPDGTALNRIFGFNETKITPLQQTPDAARAEAWEFMLNEGGVYDHLGYQWATSTQAADLRNYLGKLNTFLGSLNLRFMKKSPGNPQPPAWAPKLPDYGSPEITGSTTKIYWAAMQESPQGIIGQTNGYALYIHHSQLDSSKRNYVKPASINRLTMLKVQLGTSGQAYTVTWTNPSTGLPLSWIDPSTGLSISTTQIVADGMTKTLTVPNYTYDIALTLRGSFPTLSILDCAPF